MKSIYLDNLATTPIDPRVLDAMMPFFTEHFGNASSAGHMYGMTAAEAVRRARHAVADALGADDDEIFFTSGATESNNLVLRGVVEAGFPRKRRVITSAVEHASILETAREFERVGVEVVVLPVDARGRIRLPDLERALGDGTALVSVQQANNEIGTVQDIAAIARLCGARGVPFHSDMAQSFGKLPASARDIPVDFASLSAHKIHGPKGCGALFIRGGAGAHRLVPQITGGGQQQGVRAGTLNVAAIAGFAAAARLCVAEMAEETARVRGLRERLESALTRALPDLRVNSDPVDGLPGVLHVSVPDVDQGALLGALRGVALSSGSACASETGRPSHVLEACGLLDDHHRASLRISLGRFTTGEEVEAATDIIVAGVRKLSKLSAF